MAKGSSERSAATPQQALVVGDTVYFSLNTLGLDELAHPHREKVERFVRHVSPKGGIIGALVVELELRPVTYEIQGRAEVVKLIRLLPPEVTRVPHLLSSLQEGLLEVRALDTTQQWGEFEERVWVSRPIQPVPLRTFLEQKAFPPIRFFDFALRLVRTVERYHERGIIHGHLNPRNIAFTERDELRVLDPLLASTVLRARKHLDPHFIPANFATFAPEIVEHGEVSFSSDLYGLSTVFQELLDYAPAGSLPGFRELTHDMSSPDPALRPELKEVSERLDAARRFCIDPDYQATKHEEREEKSVELPEEESSRKPAPKRDLPRTPVVHPVTAQPLGAERAPAEPTPTSSPVETPALARLTGASVSGWSGIAVGAIVLVGFLFVKLFLASEDSDVEEGPIFDKQAIVEAWQSGIPSQMEPVAALAIDPEEPNTAARALILKSAFSGDDRNGTIDALFLRVAFDRRWEITLNEADRRVALTLALAKLVKNASLEEAPDLHELHPAIHLALLVSRGRQASQELSQIPAAGLLKLPSPFNLAFRQLLSENPNLTLSDPGIQKIASYSFLGFSSVDDVVTFIQQKPTVHLRAVASVFSSDPSIAKKILTLFLSEPRLKLEEVTWAKAAGLPDWRILKGGEQLLLLSGIPPNTDVGETELFLMTRHPSLDIRKAALDGLQKLPNFEHPAKNEVFRLLQQNPGILAADQLAPLMSLLKSPGSASLDSQTIKRWLSTAPPLPILEHLILSTAKLDHYTPVDALVGYYLREIGWKPSVEQLTLLSGHPEPNIRFHSYLSIFDLPDKEKSLSMLKSAAEREDVEEYKKQLDLMIGRLQPPEQS